MLKKLLVCFIISSVLFAQGNKRESGLPFITTFKPKDFGGDYYEDTVRLMRESLLRLTHRTLEERE